jgi:hypothetical protein
MYQLFIFTLPGVALFMAYAWFGNAGLKWTLASLYNALVACGQQGKTTGRCIYISQLKKQLPVTFSSGGGQTEPAQGEISPAKKGATFTGGPMVSRTPALAFENIFVDCGSGPLDGSRLSFRYGHSVFFTTRHTKRSKIVD